MPGVLFVQGWGSGQEQYLARAREIAALGCVCLTFEPRGVARGDPEHETVTREENLRDILAAYDCWPASLRWTQRPSALSAAATAATSPRC